MQNDFRREFAPLRLLAFLALILARPAQASLANVYIGQTATGAGTGASCSNAIAVAFFNTSSNWGTGSSQVTRKYRPHLRDIGQPRQGCHLADVLRGWSFRKSSHAVVRERSCGSGGLLCQCRLH